MSHILEQLKTVKDVKEILTLNEREFKAVIGVSPVAFTQLLEPFTQSERTLKQEAEAKRERPRQRRPGGGRKATLPTPASRLGFLLHYCKGYDTLDDLGDQVGFHRSNVSRTIEWLFQVLLHTLTQLNVLPKREFTSPAELGLLLAEMEALVIDATERPIRRPQDATEQKKVTAAKSIKTR